VIGMTDQSEYRKNKDLRIRELAQRIADYFGGELRRRKEYKYAIYVDGKFLTEIYHARECVRFEFKEIPVKLSKNNLWLHDSKRYMELGYLYYYNLPDDDFEPIYAWALQTL